MYVGMGGVWLHTSPAIMMPSSPVSRVQRGSSIHTYTKVFLNIKSSYSYCKPFLSLAQSRQGIVSRARQTTRQSPHTQQAPFHRGSSRSAIVMAASNDLPAVDIAIIGGGPGGLITALALIGAGFSVRLYERRAPKRVGAILSLFPNGLEALSRIRLAPYDEVGLTASHSTHCKGQQGAQYLVSSGIAPIHQT